MNLLWIAGLTLLVAIEKLAPRGALVGKAAGVALIAWGAISLSP
jgi:predicted metal-binding membrane protein